MRHFIATVGTLEDVDAFLQQQETAAAVASACSCLLQVFSGRPEENWLAPLLQRLGTALPDAIVVGSSSSGEIADGQVLTGKTVLSLLCFSATELKPLMSEGRRGNEFATGEEIGRSLADLEDLRGVLLLAPSMELDCAQLLAGIEKQLPGVAVFGGGAGADDAGRSAVFGLGRISTLGVVAVGLTGKSLSLRRELFLGWKELGPRMTLTDVADNRIRTIDGRPAFEVYSRYLRIEPGDDLFLLEYPLLLERNGHTIARNPVSSDSEGAVTMVSDVHVGECARLGYLDIDTVLEAVSQTFTAIRAFRPDALLLYSCICRRFSLQQEVVLETAPFQRLAPVAGFFTYGEFTSMGGRLQLLNSSQVMVALREGDEGQELAEDDCKLLGETDRARLRHMRVSSRLFQFVSALTEELEAANQQLRHQAEHDALTHAYNRQRLDSDLGLELSRAQRHDRPLSLVMLDVDHFKQFNDRWGHIAGDHVLKKVVETAAADLRSHDRIFRFGGEEFLLLLPDIDADGAVAVAERIRAAIAAMQLHFNDNPLSQVTASFGVATNVRHGTTSERLLEAADAALYFAKQDGRNRVVVAPDHA